MHHGQHVAHGVVLVQVASGSCTVGGCRLYGGADALLYKPRVHLRLLCCQADRWVVLQQKWRDVSPIRE